MRWAPTGPSSQRYRTGRDVVTVIRAGGDKIPVRFRQRCGRLIYRFETEIPEISSSVPVRIELRTQRRPWRAAVFVDAPKCLRHRYDDGSLCMWWAWHPKSRRWVLSDGLGLLVHYVRKHLFQEACCRAGLPWPGEEAPGDHPRPSACPTCGGVGP